MRSGVLLCGVSSGPPGDDAVEVTGQGQGIGWLDMHRCTVASNGGHGVAVVRGARPVWENAEGATKDGGESVKQVGPTGEVSQASKVEGKKKKPGKQKTSACTPLLARLTHCAVKRNVRSGVSVLAPLDLRPAAAAVLCDLRDNGQGSFNQGAGTTEAVHGVLDVQESNLLA